MFLSGESVGCIVCLLMFFDGFCLSSSSLLVFSRLGSYVWPVAFECHSLVCADAKMIMILVVTYFITWVSSLFFSCVYIVLILYVISALYCYVRSCTYVLFVLSLLFFL